MPHIPKSQSQRKLTRMVRSIRDRSSGCVLHNLIAIEYLQLSQMTTVGRPLSIILNRYSLSKLKERGRREPIARRLEPWPCSLAEAVEAAAGRQRHCQAWPLHGNWHILWQRPPHNILRRAPGYSSTWVLEYPIEVYSSTVRYYRDVIECKGSIP